MRQKYYAPKRRAPKRLCAILTCAEKTCNEKSVRRKVLTPKCHATKSGLRRNVAAPNRLIITGNYCYGKLLYTGKKLWEMRLGKNYLGKKARKNFLDTGGMTTT